MVAPKTLGKERTFTGDIGTDSIDQSRADLADVLRLCPFIRGRLVSVRFAAGVRKVVRHGLGVSAACIVVRPNYDGSGLPSRISEDADATTGVDTRQQIALLSDETCAVDLWFYPRPSRTIDARQGQSL